jgi:hypothetical protein
MCGSLSALLLCAACECIHTTKSEEHPAACLLVPLVRPINLWRLTLLVLLGPAGQRILCVLPGCPARLGFTA